MQKNDILGFMRRKNISQKELAKILSCTEPMISFLISGRSKPTYDKIRKLLEMGATVEELFGLPYAKGSPTTPDQEFKEKFLACLNEVSSNGTIQIGVRG